MINVIGNVFDSSGYSIHCRELTNALSKQTEVSLTTGLVPNWERMVTDKELEMIKKQDDGQINLIITNPIFWKLHTNAKRNWAFLVWEGDKIPKSFINECVNPDIEFIFVPSNHTKEAIENTSKDGDNPGESWKLIRDKIKVMPHGVDLNKFYPKEREEKETTTFLANKGFRNLEDRGGIQYLLKAYLEEFTNEDKVELLIKINPAYGIPDLNKILKDLGYKEGGPSIRFDVGLYDYDKLINFYKGDCFVSPTRAESFNLPCIEAMACGLPVITTNFGGQTDFCDNNTGKLISGELTEIKHEIQYEGIKWITPNIQELRDALRDCHKNKKEWKLKGQNALERSREYTWDKTAQKIIDLI